MKGKLCRKNYEKALRQLSKLIFCWLAEHFNSKRLAPFERVMKTAVAFNQYTPCNQLLH